MDKIGADKDARNSNSAAFGSQNHPQKLLTPENNALPEWVKKIDSSSWDLLVWVQPGAKKHEIVGCREGRLKIRLAAPAVDNKANKALLAYLAKLLKIKQNQLSLESGECARQKRLRLNCLVEPNWRAILPVLSALSEEQSPIKACL